MKLSLRYNRVNLVTSLIVLLITGLTYYVVIHYILTNQLDKDLDVEEQEIIEYARTYQKLPLPDNFKDQKVEYTLLQSNQLVERRYLYTEYRNRKENEIEPGRSLITSLRFKNQLYMVTITKSRLEAEDLIRIIFLITLTITGLLLIGITLINRFILNRLWKPFYTILDQMKAFNMADKSEIFPEATNINEFGELNKAAMSMSSRVKQDYKDLKSFTDNASHEMLTPLAVINSKLDMLLQTGSFTNSQGELLNDVYNAVGRLSRLNQSLLLLAKIENNLIQGQDTVDLKELVFQKIRQFHELLETNHIRVYHKLEHKELILSKYLADILLNNLIINAIRHNYDGGEIEINLTDNQLSIINTGHKQELDSEKAFERFNKVASSDGMGLGLAISKQICAIYHFDLKYNYQTEKHIFTIVF